MKKVLFLMLFLMVLGAVGIRAQVRIGGNTAPSAAAVLDLNATDLANNGTGGLTLPRVSLGALSGTTANLNGTTPLTGMLVYNTNSTLGVGVYFWNGSQWVLISGNGVVGNALMDTIPGGGLNKTGTGTAVSPYKVGIKTGGVTTGMIANGAVTTSKLSTVASDSGLILTSDGKNVMWGALAFSADTGSVYTATSPQVALTLSKIKDTTLYSVIGSRKYKIIFIQNLSSATDFCTANATIPNYVPPVPTMMDGAVMLVNLYYRVIPYQVRLRCYRAI